jgi:hypothetical protein
MNNSIGEEKAKIMHNLCHRFFCGRKSPLPYKDPPGTPGFSIDHQREHRVLLVPRIPEVSGLGVFLKKCAKSAKSVKRSILL